MPVTLDSPSTILRFLPMWGITCYGRSRRLEIARTDIEARSPAASTNVALGLTRASRAGTFDKVRGERYGPRLRFA